MNIHTFDDIIRLKYYHDMFMNIHMKYTNMNTFK